MNMEVNASSVPVFLSKELSNMWHKDVSVVPATTAHYK